MRTGTITSAARELSVTHGAVSQQLRALEAALGQPLFVRQGRSLVANEAARALFPSLRDALRSIREATGHLQDPPSRSTLRVSCVPALLSYWLLPRLGDYRRRHPLVELVLIASNSPEPLIRGAADIAILYREPGDEPGLEIRRWHGTALFPVLSPALLAHEPLRRRQDLARHCLLHADDGTEWNRWLRPAGVAGAAAQMFFSDVRLALDAAICGLGVALGDRVTTDPLLTKGELVMPLTRMIDVPETFLVATRAGDAQGPARRTFIDWFFSGQSEP